MTLKKKPKPLTRDNPLDDLRSGDLAPHRQCPAMSKRTGERCKNMCGLGKRSCRMHGSANAISKVAAAKRIANASGHAAAMLVEFMNDPKVELKQRVQIAQDLLTRAGLSGKTELHVDIDWSARVDAAVVNWDELEVGEDLTAIYAEVVDDDYQPQDATLDVSERPNPHLDQRRAQVEASVSRSRRVADKEQPPWSTDESGAQTATRLADEHRRATFASEKASKGLTPRRGRKR